MYLQRREKIWILMTIRILEARGINIFVEPVPCVLVSLRNNKRPDSFLHDTLKDCYTWMQQGGDIKLSVPRCQALLEIMDAVTWKLTETGGQKYKLHSSRRSLDNLYHNPEARAPAFAELRLPMDFKLPITIAESEAIFPRGFQKYWPITFGRAFGPRVVVRCGFILDGPYAPPGDIVRRTISHSLE